MLGIGSNHEPRHVLYKQQRNALPLAPLNVERDLFGTLSVDDAAKARSFTGSTLDESALVGNDADRNAFNARVTANHFFREMRLELIDLTVIKHRLEQLVHVVLHTVIGGQQVVQLLRRYCGWTIRAVVVLCRLGQTRNQLAQLVET